MSVLRRKFVPMEILAVCPDWAAVYQCLEIDTTPPSSWSIVEPPGW